LFYCLVAISLVYTKFSSRASNLFIINTHFLALTHSVYSNLSTVMNENEDFRFLFGFGWYFNEFQAKVFNCMAFVSRLRQLFFCWKCFECDCFERKSVEKIIIE
jgi:hypothetical protein